MLQSAPNRLRQIVNYQTLIRVSSLVKPVSFREADEMRVILILSAQLAPA